MSAEEDGRGDESRERRGENGRRETPPRGKGGPRGGPGGPRDRRGGGPREGSPRGRSGGGKGNERDPRGRRDARKPGRPFKRADDRRSETREGRSGDNRDRRPGGPRDERREGRPGAPRGGARGGQGGERREGRFPGARDSRPGREKRPGARQAGGGQGERRFPDREGRGGRDERRPGGRRFEGRREGRPGDRDRPFKGRGDAKRPYDGGGRPTGPRRDRDDRRIGAAGRERSAPAHPDPVLPDDVTGGELDTEARAELRTLPKELATKVARHLVMAGRLAEEDPGLAFDHAKAARRLASRVGIVREAAGIAAYHAGEWAEALAELRAARRLGAGDDAYLPVMADCERGLGRPERALDLIKSPEAKKLDAMGRVELRIVESGVRRDLGQHDAAVVTLQIPELRDKRLRPWSARLFYAYADALTEAGRESEASEWFARAAAADRDGETDAAERYAELEGLHIIDTEEEDEAEDGDAAEGDAEKSDIQTDDAVADDAEQAENEAEAEAGEIEAAGDADNAAEGGDAQEAAPAAAPDSGPAPATGIEFKAAEPEAPKPPAEPEEGAPDAPAVFLEPKPAEGKPAGEGPANGGRPADNG